MSATDNQMTLDADQLNPTDRAILDELREGRATPAYVAEKHGYSTGNVRNRMTMLKSHDHVEGLGGGLYELVDDPREDGDQEAGPDIDPEALQLKIRDLRAERDELQQRLEEQAQQADADVADDRADRVVVDLTNAHERAVSAQESREIDPTALEDIEAYLERALEVLDE